MTILQDERVRHPRMTERDLCKLLYQAVFGGDHWLRFRGPFLAALASEWHRLPASLPGGALQLIDPQGKTARLHLVGAREAGVTLDELGGVLVNQGMKSGDPRRFRRLVGRVARLARDGRLPFDGAALETSADARSPGHHSPAFGPAHYRLIHDVTAPVTREWLAGHELG